MIISPLYWLKPSVRFDWFNASEHASNCREDGFLFNDSIQLFNTDIFQLLVTQAQNTLNNPKQNHMTQVRKEQYIYITYKYTHLSNGKHIQNS